MKFTLKTAAIVAIVLARSAMAQDQDPQQPTASPDLGLNLNKFNNLGCYSDAGGMWDMGPYIYQTTGWCQPLCVRQGVSYFALVNGTNCFCGNSAPDGGKKVSDDECNQPCNGFNQQTCGGNNMWQVYQDGYRNGDSTGTIFITTPTQTWFGHQATFGASTTSGADKNSGPSTVVSVVTLSNGASEATEVPASQTATESTGPNKAVVAAGVVVGLVALTGIIGGIFFYMRRQKNKALEEERRRHESVTNFVTRGEKPPSTFSNADSRLEPSVMFQRRQSDGSIMDNQDYSRRILKIANPDDR